jgi:cell wall-associated NlpC family hydrolase
MSNPRAQFALTTPSKTLDPRVHAVRGDLADIALAGRHFSQHYAAPVPRLCARPWTPICTTPGGVQSSELLSGEGFMLLDTAGGWSWGWSAHDHYVGYVETAALAEGASIAAEAGRDALAIARSFLGMAYLWGGRGGAGIDCSGLVQRAMAAIGVAAPRDSDMQAASLGSLVPDKTPKSCDLVFFPGHVGLMADDVTLIHATRHHGKVVEEPLAEVVARISAKRGEGIVAVRRVA